jgi:hypothetical protein
MNDPQSQYTQPYRAYQTIPPPSSTNRVKWAIMAAAIFIVLTIIVLLFAGFDEPKRLSIVGPISHNAATSNAHSDGLYFYSGSSFGKLDTSSGEVSALTNYFSMSSVISASMSQKYAVVQTTSHDPGTEQFNQLFNHKEGIQRIDVPHFWIIDYASNEFRLLSDVIDGEPTASVATSDKSIIVSSRIGEEYIGEEAEEAEGILPVETQLYEFDGEGLPVSLFKLDGNYRLVDAVSGFFLFFEGGSYWYYDQNSQKLEKLGHSFIDQPFLTRNGSIVGVVTTESQEGANKEQEDVDSSHDDEGRGFSIIPAGSLETVRSISSSQGSLVRLGYDEIAIIREASDKSLTIEVLDEFGGKSALYEFEHNGQQTGLLRASRLGDGFVLVDNNGAVFLAGNTGSSAQTVSLGEVRRDCVGKKFCIEPITANSIKVNIYTGDSDSIKEEVFEYLEQNSINPLFYSIRWLDLTSIN